jgi:hypothetical protein
MPRCDYHNYNKEQCTSNALDNNIFCASHKYIAANHSRLAANEKRKSNVPVTKVKAKIKKPVAVAEDGALPKKVKAKIKTKIEFTRGQCQKWQKMPSINPKTGRMIKINGPTFISLQKACTSYGIGVDKREGTFGDLHGCLNDSDPVGGDQYAQLQEDEIRNLIKLGSGMCYPLATLYGWYKSKVQSSEGATYKVTDPMVPSYVLTSQELAIIDQYMHEQNNEYTKPKPKPVLRPPAGYILEVDQDWLGTIDIHPIYVIRPDGNRRIVGMLPMTVNEGGVESYAVMFKLYDAWNKGVLFLDNDPEGYTGIPILDATAPGPSYNHHWWNTIGGVMITQPMSSPDTRNAIVTNLGLLQEALDSRSWAQ